MVITIGGIGGALTPRNNEDAVALATELIQAGYAPRINGLLVAIDYAAPGYDTLVWQQGDYCGLQVPR